MMYGVKLTVYCEGKEMEVCISHSQIGRLEEKGLSPLRDLYLLTKAQIELQIDAAKKKPETLF